MKYIERDTSKCFGMPSLIGRRLTVFNIVSQISIDGLHAFIADFQVTEQQVYAALVYCKGLACKIKEEGAQFCDGCILRDIVDGYSFDKEDYIEITDNLTVSKVDNSIFLGNVNELESAEKGVNTWEIAAELLVKYF